MGVAVAKKKRAKPAGRKPAKAPRKATARKKPTPPSAAALRKLRPSRIAIGADRAPMPEALSSKNKKPARSAAVDGGLLAPVLNASVHPYLSIAYLQITYEQGQQTTGTAFFIGPRALATAGHNVRHPQYGKATDWLVTPAAFGNVANVVTVPATCLYPTAGAGPLVGGDDWAVLGIDDPAIGHRHGWFWLKDFGAVPSLDHLYVCGYANTAGPRAQYRSGGPLVSHSNSFYNYGFDTDEGMSGSPLFYYVEGQPIRFAIGIHISENANGARARRITGAVFDKLAQLGKLD